MKPACMAIPLALALVACGRPEPVSEAKTAPPPPPPAAAAGASKPLSDASLAAIVRSALQSESSLDARNIEVENREGNVTLRGRVQSEAQREKAERIVASVGGVKSVTNSLTVEGS